MTGPDYCVNAVYSCAADYALIQSLTLTTTARIMIAIRDDDICESDEKFEIILTSLLDCAIVNSPVPVYIIDNDGKFMNAFY